MPVLGAATLELNADGAKLEADLGAAVQKGAMFGAALGEVIGKAITRVADHFFTLTKNAIDTADELNKMSQKVGVSVESLSELAAAAKLSDVSLGSLRNGLKEVATHASDALRNTKGKSAEAFRSMGIDVKQYGGDTEEIFNAVMQKLGSYEDDANKVALANALMGRSAQELIPMANELEKNRQLAKDLGLTLDKDTAEAANRFKDNLTIASLASQAMGARIAQVLLPTLEKFSGFLVENAKNTERLDTVTRAADTGLKLLATAGTIVATTFQIVGERVGAAAAGISLMAQGKIREAFNTMVSATVDTGTRIGEAVARIQLIWEEAGAKAEGSAESNGKKLAAPAIAAAKRVKDESEKIARAIEELQEMAARDTFEAWDHWTKKELESQKEAREQKESGMKAWFETIDREQEDAIEKGREFLELEKLQAKELKDGEKFAKDLGLTFTSAFEDAIVGGKKFSDVLKGLEQDIARIIIRKSITEPIGGAISKGIGGIDWGEIFGGKKGGGDDPYIYPGEARAEGGPVSAGSPYLVGERGPELFVPGASGAIVPNHALGGGGSLSVQFNIQSLDPSTEASVIMRQRGLITGMIEGAYRKAGRRSGMALG